MNLFYIFILKRSFDEKIFRITKSMRDKDLNFMKHD
jgi:hypothetical protein